MKTSSLKMYSDRSIILITTYVCCCAEKRCDCQNEMYCIQWNIWISSESTPNRVDNKKVQMRGCQLFLLVNFICEIARIIIIKRRYNAEEIVFLSTPSHWNSCALYCAMIRDTNLYCRWKKWNEKIKKKNRKNVLVKIRESIENKKIRF